MAFLGNGDVYSHKEWYSHVDAGVDACMLARGILVKPWLPTEIKERRDWDISAQERLALLKDFTHFGLEYWGSDDFGVKNTRKFLLEHLNFTHR